MSLTTENLRMGERWIRMYPEDGDLSILTVRLTEDGGLTLRVEGGQVTLTRAQVHSLALGVATLYLEQDRKQLQREMLGEDV